MRRASSSRGEGCRVRECRVAADRLAMRGARALVSAQRPSIGAQSPSHVRLGLVVATLMLACVQTAEAAPFDQVTGKATQTVVSRDARRLPATTTAQLTLKFKKR